MFGVTDYGAFVLAVIVFLAIPGPGNLALVTSTGKGGLRGGFAATFGVISGDQALLWLAVTGLSALLSASPAAFSAVRLGGALYLGWLGVLMLLAKPGDGPVLNLKAGDYFGQAFLITLLNPKAIVFYMAFFPLFVDTKTYQGFATFGFMAVTIATLTLAYGAVVVLITHYFAKTIQRSRWMNILLEKTAGCILLGFGLKLALNW